MKNSAANFNPFLQAALEQHRAGRLAEAESLYREALARDPGDARVMHLLGVLAAQSQRPEAALELLGEAVARRPDFPEAQCDLGNVLMGQGRLEEAIAAFKKAIALAPGLAQAHFNLGNALKDRGQITEAMVAYRQAVGCRPDYAKAWGNLGNLLLGQGHLDEAIAAQRRAIALDPGFAMAYSNLGQALAERGLLDEAISACRKAIALAPDLAAAHNNLGNALTSGGRLDEALAAYRQAMALSPAIPQAHTNLVFTLHFHPGQDARSIAEELGRWQRRHAAGRFIERHGNDRDPARRLRIGYVSPNFREHAVGRFLLPLLAHHDKRAIEAYAYAHVLRPDRMTEAMRSHVDVWRDLGGLDDDQAAELIRRDRIDILVDLTMHMGDSRLLIFARKPAPVQATYLAYCASTGLATMDYRLSDPHLDPPGGEEESFHAERTLRLPETYWCYQPPAGTPEVNPLPATESQVITFGCLNNFSKVNPQVQAVWASVLAAVPDSQLLLHAPEGAHRQELQARLQGAGIDPGRVRFAPMAALADYFRLYHAMDIALDTFPYAGGTTTCDALWMGVPVVSLAGARAVGRGGASILTNAGLPELITRDPEGYVRVACELAGDLVRLARLRGELRGRMERSPLMNAPRFARNVEEAYRQMWRTWCAASA